MKEEFNLQSLSLHYIYSSDTTGHCPGHAERNANVTHIDSSKVNQYTDEYESLGTAYYRLMTHVQYS